MVHPALLENLQRTSWHEKHPVVVALALDTMRAFLSYAMLDGDYQRASLATLFNVFVCLGPDMFGINAGLSSPRISECELQHAPVALPLPRPRRRRRWQTDHDVQRATPTSLQSTSAFERVGLGNGRCEQYISHSIVC